jgi:benzoyl-CoA 2,3-dioxygenase component A
MDAPASEVIKQHLIDPEICIRCNTCEATCPLGAVTHDSRNYVVEVGKCNACMDCIAPCPTGAIDNWRRVPRGKSYSVAEQLLWDELPPELTPSQLAAEAVATPAAARVSDALMAAGPATTAALMSASSAMTPNESVQQSNRFGATLPPWSAAHAYTNLYGPSAAQKSISASVVGNVRVTQIGREYDTHHLMLDFGLLPFPVLEGQSIGILAPGVDSQGRPHHARQYSVASARDGERPGYNNLSLAVKRVLQDHQGQAVRGVASNYLCDLQVGDKVQVIGPFGSSFLMPNHPHSNIVMICTGTGSAPMRAMTEWRRRLRQTGKFEGGKLLLFFGARSPEELPYFGPLQKLPKDFIDINFAFSRVPGQARRYVQDVMRERAADLAPLLSDSNTYFYVCGLKSMEQGVLLALRDLALAHGLSWEAVATALKNEARLHLETY